MPDRIPQLSVLGQRIIILGPTNAGKSTLAASIGKKLGMPAIHLDQFRHLPDTDWQQRPDEDFAALHDQAILEPEWVMEGNYSRLMPKRLDRATGIIVVDESLLRRTWRYLRRSLTQNERHGALAGNKDSIKFAMLQWLWKTRNSSVASRERARKSGLPHVFANNEAELNALYAAWNLTLPPV
ncbi:MAG: AAA family ATPase [Devosia sp.]|uniref:AAA family ATPase n=1 Tax=Devosia sp. TaxID=1871048 RepID=UPI0024CB78E9|nr:AAA family ATPase [Devosia sp.]UYO00473.1 MAG: AAA family ATPase [Devosia sp.]